jgi:hypothetical protein
MLPVPADHFGLLLRTLLKMLTRMVMPILMLTRRASIPDLPPPPMPILMLTVSVAPHSKCCQKIPPPPPRKTENDFHQTGPRQKTF